MLTASLLLNVFVLVPVCLGLWRRSPGLERVYGPPSPARAILLSVYLAILAASALLLWLDAPASVRTLLALPVGYKLASPFAVGTLRNPVVLSNLAIAAFHALAIAFTWPPAAA